MSGKPNYKKVARISYKMLSPVSHLTDIKLKAQTNQIVFLDTRSIHVYSEKTMSNWVNYAEAIPYCF